TPGAGAGGPAGAAPATGGGVLRPGYVDPRLVVKPGSLPPPGPKSDIERYREHLAERIDAVNSGAAEEAAHEHRLHNWTWKDSKGREWGLGAGGVPIIAGHRLPTAIAPPIPRDRDRENAERERARRTAEIEAQDDATQRDRHLRERARATRARQDSIRNARKNDPKTP
ncbi:MAG: hypothetical protein JWM27_3617, partial [Gemmatimonadetes bacterium]|nr:hypothetical protein [Gemmatimonadota bacterium]